MDNDANILVTQDGSFEVIDFDKAFWDVVKHPSKKIINPFSYEIKKRRGKDVECVPLPDRKLMKHFGRRTLDRLISEEEERAYENIHENFEMFQEIIDLMAGVPYYNLSAQELYGDKDVAAYFLRKCLEMRPKSGWIHHKQYKEAKNPL